MRKHGGVTSFTLRPSYSRGWNPRRVDPKAVSDVAHIYIRRFELKTYITFAIVDELCGLVALSPRPEPSLREAIERGSFTFIVD
jgi:hypothetical protein